MEASKRRRRSMLDYRMQKLSKGSSKGSGIIPEVPMGQMTILVAQAAHFLDLIMKFKMSPMIRKTKLMQKLQRNKLEIPLAVKTVQEKLGMLCWWQKTKDGQTTTAKDSIHNDDGNPSRANIKQALRISDTYVGNPIKKILLNLNLPDHRKEDGDGIWHAEVRLTEPYENVDDQGFMNKPTKRKLSKYHKLSDVMSPNVLNKISCTEEIENMLEIKVYEAGSREDIFSSEAYRRVFYINELIYTELCHEFYSTYDFGEFDFARVRSTFRDYWLSISSPEELQLSRSLALTIKNPILRVLQKMITYGLSKHQNGYVNVAWLMAKWLKRKGVGSQKDSMICCGQLITKIAKKIRLLTDEVLNSLSAPTYCRALDTTTLGELIDSEGRLIPKVPAPRVPRVFPEAQDYLRWIYMTRWVAWRFVRERLRGWLIGSHITGLIPSDNTYYSYSIEEDMADKKTESTMKEFSTNDQEDYYSGITYITVNGKNAYELKGKFLDDLHNNAFDGTNGEDAVKHIEYFLIIVDLIDLPNFVNYKTMDIFTKRALWDYWKMGSDEIKPTDDESSDLEETDHDDDQEIGEIFRIETKLFNYETLLCKEFKEFNYLLKIDPDLLTKEIKGFKTYEEFKDDWIYEWNKDVPWVDEKPWTNTGDYEWYEALEDCKLKADGLRNKAIMEGLINDDNDDESHHEADEREELCEIHELTVCTIRRFKMIKYSFEQDEEYVAVKEDEYDDLARTNKNNICGDQITSLEKSKHQKNMIKEQFIGGGMERQGEDLVEKNKDVNLSVAQAPDEICLGINWNQMSGLKKIVDAPKYMTV
ncbi:hypothetical protein Tco_0150145 [Tanacetum coccineum]